MFTMFSVADVKYPIVLNHKLGFNLGYLFTLRRLCILAFKTDARQITCIKSKTIGEHH